MGWVELKRIVLVAVHMATKTGHFVKFVVDKMQILDFYSEKCIPCKTMDKLLKKIIKDYPDLDIRHINVYNEPDAVLKYGVTGVPTLLMGSEKMIGTRFEQEIRDFIERNK
jgi:thiol-disulfide isomerase/thioredoxin